MRDLSRIGETFSFWQKEKFLYIRKSNRIIWGVIVAMQKTIEVVYEDGVFKPLEKVEMEEKTNLRIRIESGGLYELIEELSEMFRDVKEDPLKILLENRR